MKTFSNARGPMISTFSIVSSETSNVAPAKNEKSISETLALNINPPVQWERLKHPYPIVVIVLGSSSV